MSIEALKLTLEALQDYVDEYGPWSDDSGAQFVLRVGREVLAKPEQEPVAWLHWLNGPVRLFLNKDEAMLELERLNRDYPVDAEHRKMRPLVLGDTTPPQRKPLSDEECGVLWTAAVHKASLPPNRSALLHYKDAIEDVYCTELKVRQTPLTRTQISNALADTHIEFGLGKHSSYAEAFTRAIEAAHGIKE